MKLLNYAVLLSALTISTEAFFFPETVPTASVDARAGRTAFERLANVELTSVATGESVLLTSQWNQQRCVIEFLRHFGWVFCWERAVALKRDVIPALEEKNIPLYVVGIGSIESGQTFAKQLDFDVNRLLVDTSKETDVYKALGTRNSQRNTETGKQQFEGIKSMWSQASTDAIETPSRRADLDSITGKLFNPGPYKPLMPSNMEATFVQGASLVFDGQTTLLEHYDEASGDHVSIEELLKAALS